LSAPLSSLSSPRAVQRTSSYTPHTLSCPPIPRPRPSARRSIPTLESSTTNTNEPITMLMVLPQPIKSSTPSLPQRTGGGGTSLYGNRALKEVSSPLLSNYLFSGFIWSVDAGVFRNPGRFDEPKLTNPRYCFLFLPLFGRPFSRSLTFDFQPEPSSTTSNLIRTPSCSQSK
jgi:hypothetical protein